MRSLLSITTKTVLHAFGEYFPNIGACRVSTEDQRSSGEIYIESHKMRDTEGKFYFRREETHLKIKEGSEVVFDGSFSELIDKLKVNK